MTDRRAVEYLSNPGHRPDPGTGGVLVDDDGPLRVVTLDRPERRNAVDSKSASALLEAFEAFDADDSLAVAVLTGPAATSAPVLTYAPWPMAIGDP